MGFNYKVRNWSLRFCPYCNEIGGAATDDKMALKSLEIHMWRMHGMKIDLSTKQGMNRLHSLQRRPIIMIDLAKAREGRPANRRRIHRCAMYKLQLISTLCPLCRKARLNERTVFEQLEADGYVYQDENGVWRWSKNKWLIR